jgi:hypothetical protein
MPEISAQREGRASEDRDCLRLPFDESIAAWAAAARPVAAAAVAESAEPWRCGGTWFAGVDALPNAPDGSVGGVALPPAVLQALPWRPAGWHRAQLSTLRPGYPQPGAGEGDAAFRYRLTRDAAHVDGLLPVGPARRRHLCEPHGFILGLPLTAADSGAAPLVVWEGSAALVRQALAAALAPHPPADWAEVDITAAYHAARRAVFATCRRVERPARPGEALLLHRLTLHGTAPWADGARADPPGRMIAWFRPELPRLADWLDPG